MMQIRTKSDLDRWAESTAEKLEASTHEAIVEVAKFAASEVKRLTYPNRKQTRQAVRHRVIARRTAVVGLYFGRKYSTSRNTFTYRHFRDVWDNDVRPLISGQLVKLLNRRLRK